MTVQRNTWCGAHAGSTLWALRAVCELVGQTHPPPSKPSFLLIYLCHCHEIPGEGYDGVCLLYSAMATPSSSPSHCCTQCSTHCLVRSRLLTLVYPSCWPLCPLSSASHLFSPSSLPPCPCPPTPDPPCLHLRASQASRPQQPVWLDCGLAQ